MQPDPWADIGRAEHSLTARRVDPDHPADFFWAKDAQGRCALVLTVSKAVSVDAPRPKLNGIDIVEAPAGDDRAFVLILRKGEDRDLFWHLCKDIVDVCRGLRGQREYLSATIKRTWRWHSLLRGGASLRLGTEEQQGLIGELHFLARLAQATSPKAAIEAWRGPLGEPKDFVFGNRAVEVKTRHAGKGAVKISSEFQLQVLEGQSLALAVYALGPATAEATGAFTLDQMVAAVRSSMISADLSAGEAMDSRLLAAGYSSEHDYSDLSWQLLHQTAYRVDRAFPRLEAASLPPAVRSVTYWIELQACGVFEIDIETLLPSETNA